ncbi:hypothetical protein SUGI_0402020 [Cryptomeria japonica]|nr:hypothetical protein SUGI_0402020 [Cryptomeria japonica]
MYINNVDKEGWEVPRELVARNNDGDIIDNKKERELKFSYTKHPFGNMVLKDQYLEIVYCSTSECFSIWIGREQPVRVSFEQKEKNESHTLWNADIASINWCLDLYGSHPFYMDVRIGRHGH